MNWFLCLCSATYVCVCACVHVYVHWNASTRSSKKESDVFMNIFLVSCSLMERTESSQWRKMAKRKQDIYCVYMHSLFQYDKECKFIHDHTHPAWELQRPQGMTCTYSNWGLFPLNDLINIYIQSYWVGILLYMKMKWNEIAMYITTS